MVMNKNLVVYFLIWFIFNFQRQCNSLEWHIPGYNFCGPGTDFLKRTKQGEIGVNKLDEACRLHDMVYTNSKDDYLRLMADKKLTEEAWDIVKTNRSNFTEKFSARMVTMVMKVWTGYKQLFS